MEESWSCDATMDLANTHISTPFSSDMGLYLKEMEGRRPPVLLSVPTLLALPQLLMHSGL